MSLYKNLKLGNRTLHLIPPTSFQDFLQQIRRISSEDITNCYYFDKDIKVNIKSEKDYTTALEKSLSNPLFAFHVVESKNTVECLLCDGARMNKEKQCEGCKGSGKMDEKWKERLKKVIEEKVGALVPQIMGRNISQLSQYIRRPKVLYKEVKVLEQMPELSSFNEKDNQGKQTQERNVQVVEVKEGLCKEEESKIMTKKIKQSIKEDYPSIPNNEHIKKASYPNIEFIPKDQAEGILNLKNIFSLYNEAHNIYNEDDEIKATQNHAEGIDNRTTSRLISHNDIEDINQDNELWQEESKYNIELGLQELINRNNQFNDTSRELQEIMENKQEVESKGIYCSACEEEIIIVSYKRCNICQSHYVCEECFDDLLHDHPLSTESNSIIQPPIIGPKVIDISESFMDSPMNAYADFNVLSRSVYVSPKVNPNREVTVNDIKIIYRGETPTKRVMESEEQFEKTWTFLNGGSVVWPEGIEMRALDTNDLKASSEKMPSINPGETCKVTLKMTAPKVPDSFKQYFGFVWKGKQLCCKVLVEGKVLEQVSFEMISSDECKEAKLKDDTTKKAIEKLKNLKLKENIPKMYEENLLYLFEISDANPRWILSLLKSNKNKVDLVKNIIFS